MEEVEEDLRKLEIQDVARKGMNRKEWRRTVKAAKTHQKL